MLIRSFFEGVYLSKFRWLFFSVFTLLFRLPYFIHSEKRMHGDEAFHWLTNQNNLSGFDVTLHPFNHDYLGVTDFLFTLPFIPFFGNSGLSNQFGLALVYLIYAFTLVRLTELVFNNSYGIVVYFLTLIPGSFLMIMSATYHGGHYESTVIGLVAVYLFFIFQKMDKINYKALLLFFCSFLLALSFYTSKLNSVTILAILPVSFIYGLYNLKDNSTKKLLLYSISIIIGIIIGLIPSYLGEIYRVVEPTHNKSVTDPRFIFLHNNLSVLLNYGIESIFGLLTHPFMRHYGYYLGKNLAFLSKIFSIICFLGIILIYIPSTYIKKIINKVINISDRKSLFLAFYYILLIGNCVALLAISKEIDDFGIRYLTPIAMLSPIIVAVGVCSLRESFKKIANSILIIYFSILIIGYSAGYTKSEFYNFEGSPYSEDVLNYLNNKNIKFSYANHWIAYNLIKSSNQSHISSPSIDLMGGMNYPGLHQRVMDGSKTEKIAIIQMLGLVPDWYNFIKVDSKGRYIDIKEGKFRILEEAVFDRWNVFICESIND